MIHGIMPAPDIHRVRIGQERSGLSLFDLIDYLPDIDGFNIGVITQFPEMQLYCGEISFGKKISEPALKNSFFSLTRLLSSGFVTRSREK